MIQQETILQVTDNSGAKTVKCIKLLEGYKKKYATLGNTIIVSIQKLRTKFNSKIKKGEIYRALIVKTKKKIKIKDNSILEINKNKQNINAVILINKKGNPIGTRLLEPIPLKLNKKSFLKIISLSPSLI